MDALGRGADIGLELFAEGVVGGGEGHLYHAFRIATNGREEVQISQHKGRLGNQCKAEAILVCQFQGAAGVLEHLGDGHIGVAHGTNPQHTALTLAA